MNPFEKKNQIKKVHQIILSNKNNTIKTKSLPFVLRFSKNNKNN